jgi:Dolichyl-phosphate-mannose-protein mannosyltransferase
VGTRRSAVVLFAVGLCVYAIESVALPVYAGRDMGRYVQAFLQLGYGEPVLPSVVATRGPIAALGVGVPLSIGGVFVATWLAVLYSASIVAWATATRAFGAAAAVLASALLLVFPGYSILFHELASDSLFAAGFAGWALLLTRAVLRPSRRAFLVLGIVTGCAGADPAGEPGPPRLHAAPSRLARAAEPPSPMGGGLLPGQHAYHRGLGCNRPPALW